MPNAIKRFFGQVKLSGKFVQASESGNELYLPLRKRL